MAQGVRIFNMSYGSQERLTSQQALTDARQRHQSPYQGLNAVAAADGLAVMITGNNRAPRQHRTC